MKMTARMNGTALVKIFMIDEDGLRVPRLKGILDDACLFMNA